jgi:hypothetical protein
MGFPSSSVTPQFVTVVSVFPPVQQGEKGLTKPASIDVAKFVRKHMKAK